MIMSSAVDFYKIFRYAYLHITFDYPLLQNI